MEVFASGSELFLMNAGRGNTVQNATERIQDVHTEGPF